MAALNQHAAQVLTALAAEQPALLQWHLGRHKRALALCIAQIGRDPDDGVDDVEVRNLFNSQVLSWCVVKVVVSLFRMVQSVLSE